MVVATMSHANAYVVPAVKLTVPVKAVVYAVLIAAKSVVVSAVPKSSVPLSDASHEYTPRKACVTVPAATVPEKGPNLCICSGLARFPEYEFEHASPEGERVARGATPVDRLLARCQRLATEQGGLIAALKFPHSANSHPKADCVYHPRAVLGEGQVSVDGWRMRDDLGHRSTGGDHHVHMPSVHIDWLAGLVDTNPADLRLATGREFVVQPERQLPRAGVVAWRDQQTVAHPDWLPDLIPKEPDSPWLYPASNNRRTITAGALEQCRRRGVAHSSRARPDSGERRADT